MLWVDYPFHSSWDSLVVKRSQIPLFPSNNLYLSCSAVLSLTIKLWTQQINQRSETPNQRMVWKDWKLFSDRRKSTGYKIIVSLFTSYLSRRWRCASVLTWSRIITALQLQCCGPWRRETVQDHQKFLQGSCLLLCLTTSKVGEPFPRGEAMKVMLVSGEIHRKSLQLVSFISLKW